MIETVIHSFRHHSFLIASFSIALLGLSGCTKKSAQPTAIDAQAKVISVGKTMRDMNYDELKMVKNSQIKMGDKETAIKYLEKMLAVCDDVEEMRLVMLELANLQFDLNHYTSAEKLYTDFTVLYPGCSDYEYALYKAIVCSFKNILGPENDQTKTQATVALARSFLDQKDLFTAYVTEVKTILDQCTDRLLAHEVAVFNFYLKSYGLTAANKRLADMKRDFATKVTTPEFEPRLLHMHYQLALAQKNNDAANKTAYELALKYPTHPISTQLAQNDALFSAVLQLANTGQELPAAGVVVAQSKKRFANMF